MARYWHTEGDNTEEKPYARVRTRSFYIYIIGDSKYRPISSLAIGPYRALSRHIGPYRDVSRRIATLPFARCVTLHCESEIPCKNGLRPGKEKRAFSALGLLRPCIVNLKGAQRFTRHRPMTQRLLTP